MASEDNIPAEGVVEDIQKDTFMVRVKDMPSSPLVKCSIGGKLRKHAIQIVAGDEVSIEISPYDLARGRIVYRHGERSRRPRP